MYHRVPLGGKLIVICKYLIYIRKECLYRYGRIESCQLDVKISTLEVPCEEEFYMWLNEGDTILINSRFLEVDYL